MKKKDGEKKTQDGILLEAISQLGHFHPMAAAQTIGYCHTQPAYRFELFFIFHQSHFLEGVFFPHKVVSPQVSYFFSSLD